MPLPQVAPGAGGERGRTHFTYVSPHGGAKPWQAWLAGPCHWFVCHTKGKSQPCLDVMTGGEVTCERCGLGHATETIGYQPLYRESDSKPVMVIVHGYSREHIDSLTLHERVLVGRNEGAGENVYVLKNIVPTPKFTSTLRSKLEPADLTETLLRVWRLPDLVTWYRQTHGATVPVPPPPPPPPPKLRSDGQPFSPMLQAAARRADQEHEKEAVNYDEAFERLNQRRKSLPSTNGKPHPKG